MGRKHLLIAAVALVVVVLVLESTSQFRNAQFASMAYFAIAAGGLTENHANVVYILRRAESGLSDQVSLGERNVDGVGAKCRGIKMRDGIQFSAGR